MGFSVIKKAWGIVVSLIHGGMVASRKKEGLKILPDDVFLVSYPRSGNTWLRFVLATVLYKDAEINFTNIHKYSPEVNRFGRDCLGQGMPNFIKSHEHFNPDFPKVVYVVRDGRDVYVSYYHYLKNKLPAGMPFRDFLLWDLKPHGNWADHVGSWLDGVSGQKLLLCKYEEMHLDPVATVRRVCDFSGVDADLESIRIALEKCTYNRMKESEINSGRGKYETGPEVFMRKGQIGDWKNYFADDEKKIFKAKENEALVKLRYEKNATW